MLHTVTAILSTNPTQANARKMLKLALSLVTAKGYNPIQDKLGEALASDMNGAFSSLTTADGTLIGTISHTLKGDDIRNLKADLNAFLDSDEFKALPTATPKAPKELVKIDNAHVAKLLTMSAAEFGRYCELNGIKAVVDRGVWSLTIPGVRGTQYYDAASGKQLAAGENATQAKPEIDARKLQGKVTALAHLVSVKRAKLTARQRQDINDFALIGEVPEVLKQFVVLEVE